jgi:ubiquinone/menaquinone biosynthesis C-methylase UbiE
MSLYGDRPGASPVVAGLFAAGVITKEDRVLDVGCGTGIDCIAMKFWGVSRVAGIDNYEPFINTAVRKARAYKIPTDGLFHLGSITKRNTIFKRAEFSVVIDSLVLNNIIHARSQLAYLSEVARVLAPGGLFVLQKREPRHFVDIDTADKWDGVPSSFLKHLRRCFKVGPIVTTHLAEFSTRKLKRDHATVAVAIARRK